MHLTKAFFKQCFSFLLFSWDHLFSFDHILWEQDILFKRNIVILYPVISRWDFPLLGRWNKNVSMAHNDVVNIHRRRRLFRHKKAKKCKATSSLYFLLIQTTSSMRISSPLCGALMPESVLESCRLCNLLCVRSRPSPRLPVSSWGDRARPLVKESLTHASWVVTSQCPYSAFWQVYGAVLWGFEIKASCRLPGARAVSAGGVAGMCILICALAPTLRPSKASFAAVCPP